MTHKELSQLYHLNREIEQDRRRLAELRCAATNTVSRISGLPHASGVSDKTALAAEIVYLSGVIENKIQRTYYEYNRLVNYINDIDDAEMRNIISLRHINGLSWQQIAFNIGYQDESTPRKRYKRFLRGESKCPNYPN